MLSSSGPRLHVGALCGGAILALACTGNQYWVFGLMRSSSFSRSGTWESFPRNPLLVPSGRKACGLQYARWIRDSSGIYLLYEDTEKGRRLFKLVPGAGPALVE